MQILLLDPDDSKARLSLKATNVKKFSEQGATGKIRLVAMKGQFEIQLKTTKDVAKKVDLCQNFLNSDPTNAKVRTVLAEALLTLGHSNGAAAEAEMAMRDDPSNVVAAKALVAANIKLNKLKEAQQ